MNFTRLLEQYLQQPLDSPQDELRVFLQETSNGKELQQFKKTIFGILKQNANVYPNFIFKKCIPLLANFKLHPNEILDLIESIELNFPDNLFLCLEQFGNILVDQPPSHFQDLIDVLVGWYLNKDCTQSIRNQLNFYLTSSSWSQKQWTISTNVSFGTNLLFKFITDMQQIQNDDRKFSAFVQCFAILFSMIQGTQPSQPQLQQVLFDFFSCMAILFRWTASCSKSWKSLRDHFSHLLTPQCYSDTLELHIIQTCFVQINSHFASDTMQQTECGSVFFSQHMIPHGCRSNLFFMLLQSPLLSMEYHQQFLSRYPEWTSLFLDQLCCEDSAQVKQWQVMIWKLKLAYQLVQTCKLHPMELVYSFSLQAVRKWIFELDSSMVYEICKHMFHNLMISPSSCSSMIEQFYLKTCPHFLFHQPLLLLFLEWYTLQQQYLQSKETTIWKQYIVEWATDAQQSIAIRCACIPILFLFQTGVALQYLWLLMDDIQPEIVSITKENLTKYGHSLFFSEKEDMVYYSIPATSPILLSTTLLLQCFQLLLSNDTSTTIPLFLQPYCTSMATTSTHVLYHSIAKQMSHYCILNKLKTPFGNAMQTFEKVEELLKHSSPLQLLLFFFVLELETQITTLISNSQLESSVKYFFTSNSKVCQEWFHRWKPFFCSKIMQPHFCSVETIPFLLYTLHHYFSHTPTPTSSLMETILLHTCQQVLQFHAKQFIGCFPTIPTEDWMSQMIHITNLELSDSFEQVHQFVMPYFYSSVLQDHLLWIPFLVDRMIHCFVQLKQFDNLYRFVLEEGPQFFFYEKLPIMNQWEESIDLIHQLQHYHYILPETDNLTIDSPSLLQSSMMQELLKKEQICNGLLCTFALDTNVVYWNQMESLYFYNSNLVKPCYTLEQIHMHQYESLLHSQNTNTLYQRIQTMEEEQQYALLQITKQNCILQIISQEEEQQQIITQLLQMNHPYAMEKVLQFINHQNQKKKNNLTKYNIIPNMEMIQQSNSLQKEWITFTSQDATYYKYCIETCTLFLTNSRTSTVDTRQVTSQLLHVLTRCKNNEEVLVQYLIKKSILTIPVIHWIPMIPLLISLYYYHSVGNTNSIMYQIVKIIIEQICQCQPWHIVYLLTCHEQTCKEFSHCIPYANEYQLICKELQRISVLWDEIWLQEIPNLLRRCKRSNIHWEDVLSQIQHLQSQTIFKLPSSIQEFKFIEKYANTIASLSKLEASNIQWCIQQLEYLQHCLMMDKQQSYSLEQTSPQLMQCSMSHVKVYIPGKEELSCHFQPVMQVIWNSKTKPKKIQWISQQGTVYPFLIKGREDLHMDQRILHVISQFQFSCHTYLVIPISNSCGMIEWMNDALPIYSMIQKSEYKSLDLIHEKAKQFPNDKKRIYLECLKEVSSCHTVLQDYLHVTSQTYQEWLQFSKQFTKSLAHTCMIGYILGIGDRHLDNLMIHSKTKEVISIDYNVSLNKGWELKIPEIVPFRFTPILRNASLQELFEKECQVVLETSIQKKQLIMTCLESFLWNPLQEWKQWHQQLLKCQQELIQEWNTILVWNQSKEKCKRNIVEQFGEQALQYCEEVIVELQLQESFTQLRKELEEWNIRFAKVLEREVKLVNKESNWMERNVKCFEFIKSLQKNYSSLEFMYLIHTFLKEQIIAPQKEEQEESFLLTTPLKEDLESIIQLLQHIETSIIQIWNSFIHYESINLQQWSDKLQESCQPVFHTPWQEIQLSQEYCLPLFCNRNQFLKSWEKMNQQMQTSVEQFVIIPILDLIDQWTLMHVDEECLEWQKDWQYLAEITSTQWQMKQHQIWNEWKTTQLQYLNQKQNQLVLQDTNHNEKLQYLLNWKQHYQNKALKSKIQSIIEKQIRVITKQIKPYYQSDALIQFLEQDIWQQYQESEEWITSIISALETEWSTRFVKEKSNLSPPQQQLQQSVESEYEKQWNEIGQGWNGYAMRALKRVEQRLTVPKQDISKTVKNLIEQATSIDNLSQMYEGWQAYL